METIDIHLCYFCGDETDKDEWVNGKRYWYCGCDEGLKELIELSKEETTAREKAEKDNFARYK